VAALVGLGSAALVFFVFKASDQTECHRESIEISIAYSTDSLQGRPFPAFNAVRRQVTKQRTRLPANDGFPR
jgi:hypothetical protein